MCGIAGYFRYRSGASPACEQELSAMSARMRARGPDGDGLWLSSSGDVGMAHRRLAIIDLSEGGLQPMHDPQTGNVISFNGEIYNYKALREELMALGDKFLSGSDTEVILALYRRFGRAMIGKLRGMFAFAIYDHAANAVLLVRDQFGIKPLYFSDDGKGAIRFASQVKALVAGGKVGNGMSSAALTSLFLWGHVVEPKTIYNDIEALPSGSWLWSQLGSQPLRGRFFDLAEDLARVAEDSRPIREEDALRQFQEGLIDSVTHHHVADVPVGSYLSAGLDAASVTAFSRSTTDARLLGLTLSYAEFEGSPSDEAPGAAEIAECFDVEHRIISATYESFIGCLPHLLDSMDQPTIDGVNVYLVSKAAKEAGMKVALTGLGGDELFGGYSDFVRIPKLMKWGAQLSKWPIPKRALTPPLRLAGRLTGQRKLPGLLGLEGDAASAYLLCRSFNLPCDLGYYLDPKIVKEGLAELATLESLRSTVSGLRDFRHVKTDISVLLANGYMRNQLLRDADWASMAHSVELRTPLVDVELWRLVNRLRFSGFDFTKVDMALASPQPLPASLFTRPKTGFSIPVPQWLARSQGLKGGDQDRLQDWARHIVDRYDAQ